MIRPVQALATIVVTLLLVVAPAGAFSTSDVPLVIETANGKAQFTVELALTPQEHSQGLMNRASMERDHGMLFDFGRERPVSMWMKNTILALDMIFIDASGTVAGVVANTVPFSETIISSPRAVKYVLEVNAGVAAEFGIAAGDRVVHPLMDRD